MARRAMSIFSADLTIQLEYRKVCIEEDMDHNRELEDHMEYIIKTRGLKTKVERYDKIIEEAQRGKDETLKKRVVYDHEKSVDAAAEVEKILMNINTGSRFKYQESKSLFTEIKNLAKRFNKDFLEILGYYEQKSPLLIFDVDDLDNMNELLADIRSRYMDMLAQNENTQSNLKLKTGEGGA